MQGCVSEKVQYHEYLQLQLAIALNFPCPHPQSLTANSSHSYLMSKKNNIERLKRSGAEQSRVGVVAAHVGDPRSRILDPVLAPAFDRRGVACHLVWWIADFVPGSRWVFAVKSLCGFPRSNKRGRNCKRMFREKQQLASHSLSGRGSSPPGRMLWRGRPALPSLCRAQPRAGLRSQPPHPSSAGRDGAARALRQKAPQKGSRSAFQEAHQARRIDLSRREFVCVCALNY